MKKLKVSKDDKVHVLLNKVRFADLQRRFAVVTGAIRKAQGYVHDPEQLHAVSGHIQFNHPSLTANLYNHA